jgi:methylenetetrahydrofolate reductase (NADPH)
VTHDIDVLAAKVEAGADQAITQMLFDNSHYLDYIERVRARGIGIRLVPGIFPIHSFPAVARFAARCGATIPNHVARRFDGLTDDEARCVAVDVASEQIRDLADHGVEHVHIYTLNRPDLAVAICERLSLVAS